MAEMINIRDVEKILSILRRVYRAVVVDVPAAISELTLAFFDPADPVSVDELIQRADTEMYQQKHARRAARLAG